MHTTDELASELVSRATELGLMCEPIDICCTKEGCCKQALVNLEGMLLCYSCGLLIIQTHVLNAAWMPHK